MCYDLDHRAYQQTLSELYIHALRHSIVEKMLSSNTYICIITFQNQFQAFLFPIQITKSDKNPSNRQIQFWHFNVNSTEIMIVNKTDGSQKKLEREFT